MALTKEAKLGEPVVVLFMILTFLIVGFTELMLMRQLSRLGESKDQKQLQQQPATRSNELNYAEPRALHEPVASVTENTTRTLEYARKDSMPR